MYKPKHIIICFLSIVFIIIPFSASSNEYLYFEGYGKNEKKAIIDAKKNLALRLVSNVSVIEKTHQKKSKTGISESYQSDSVITTLPLEIRNIMVESHSCNGDVCKYTFKVNKVTWLQSLKESISKEHQISTTLLDINTYTWRDLNNVLMAEVHLASSRQQLQILTALSHDDGGILLQKQSALEHAQVKAKKGFDVSFRASSDPFANEVKNLLMKKVAATSNADIIFYIKSKHRQGKQGKYLVAQQKIIMQVFEATRPNVAVKEIVLSETVKSTSSYHDALSTARNKITTKLNNNVIFTLSD